MANFTISPEASNKNIQTVTLATAGKFVDRDIVVKTTTANGSFNNKATTGVTYTPNTDQNTIIPANGTLYINEGYFPNTSISLAQLIPDDVEYTNAGNDKILAGYEAYDSDGNKLIGTVSSITPKFEGGVVNVSCNGEVSTTNKPTVTVSASGSFFNSANLTSFGVMNNKPSTGTDGTNYVVIDGTGTAKAGDVNVSANAYRTAVTYKGATTGFVDKNDKDEALGRPNEDTTATNTVSVTPTVTDSFTARYVPIVTSTVTGGGLSVTASGTATTNPSAKTSVGGTFVSTAASNSTNMTKYGISTTAPSGTNGTNYFVIAPNHTDVVNGVATVNASATRDAIHEKHSGGLIKANDADVTGLGEITENATSDTVTLNTSITDGDSYYLKVVSATASLSKENVSKATATANTSVALNAATNYSSDGIKTSAPSSSTPYIKISPTLSTTAGSCTLAINTKTTDNSGTESGGIIGKVNSTSSDINKSIGVTESLGDTRYIEFYTGIYSVS